MGSTMATSIDFGAIGSALLGAAVDPSGWRDAMNTVERATGCIGAMLFDMNTRLPDIPCSESMREAFDIYVRGGWLERDERYRLAPFLMQRGVTTDLDLMTTEHIARSPYYQEFLAPLGLRWYAAVKIAAGDQVWALSLQRSIEQGPPSHEEIMQLQRLSGELGAVAALFQAIGLARADAALDAFNISGTAVLMLDRQGKALRVNAAAEKLLGYDLHLVRRELVVRDRHADNQLNLALNELLRQQRGSMTLQPVAIPRISGRPILAYPMRLSGICADVFSPCQALIVLVDCGSRPSPLAAVLKGCFGLTTAEAKLGIRMATGECLEQAAAKLGIRLDTARNQLKSIFAKTDTHRQAELALLLGRLGSPTPS
ncbi:helix-turn-helix transcriptional regulator [Rhizobium mongolense]|uniref:helix-turn-helix transcriptional regulator n=2 Tax=Rhizobium mongolense TaxID=57676 RepID=UPI0034A5A04F